MARKNLVREMMNDNQLDALLTEMGAQAEKTSESQLPSAGQIWFRAQIQRKLRRRERIERPLVVMRAIAVAICLAAALAFAGEMGGLASRSYALPLLALTAGALITGFLLAIWPATKTRLAGKA